MKVIGFAGTAKNTGKTTAVLSVMAHCRARNLRMALTSIGFDGEQRDTITSLPKPRYLLQPGDRVATACECLEAGTARLKVLYETGLKTILGNIVLAEVTQAGMVLVAGPNRRKDLDSLIHLFHEMDTDLLLVDGALNRLAPMIACEGLVLSTGAAFSSEIERVSLHAAQVAGLFNLPLDPLVEMPEHGGCIQFEDGSILKLSSGSLLEPFDLELPVGSHVSKIILPGLVNPIPLQRFVFQIQQRSCVAASLTVVLASPLKIAASGHLDAWSALMESKLVNLKVMRSIPLLAVTSCPFYPRWLHHRGEYEPAAVDALDLLVALKSSIPLTQVLDVVRDPSPDWSGILKLERS
jgi:hypothetical protein